MNFDFEYLYNEDNLEYISYSDSEFSYNLGATNDKPDPCAHEFIRKVLGISKLHEIMRTYKRAVVNNKALEQDIFRNNGKGVRKCMLKSYLRALKLLKSKLDNEDSLKTIHYNGIPNYNLNKSSSAGLPYIKDKSFISLIKTLKDQKKISKFSLSKGNGFEYIYKKEREKIRDIKDSKRPIELYIEDIRAHARSHICLKSDPDKIRAVYSVPCTVIFVEIMLLWPLIARIKDMKTPIIAWGYETLRGGLERLKQEVSDYSTHLSLDFSTFDKLVPFWLIDDVHKLWYDLYDPEYYYRDAESIIKPKTSRFRINNLWKYMNHSVKHSPYRGPDGSRYKRKHSGFPSGLLQTQILGSCCSYIMIASALFEYGYKESDFTIKALGDDTCVSIHPMCKSEEIIKFIAKYCLKNFGAIINHKKCHFSIGTECLQFLNYKFENGKVARVKKNLLAKLLYPEKPNFTPERTKTRAIGILMANLGSDKDVHAVCINIIKSLSELDVCSDDLDYYDKEILDYYLDNYKNIPSCEELIELALTPQETRKDSYFYEYIIK